VNYLQGYEGTKVGWFSGVGFGKQEVLGSRNGVVDHGLFIEYYRNFEYYY
jgi:hypothetical protein